MLTKDSVTVSVDAVVYYRVSNATVSVANVENAHHSTRLLAQTTLRNTMGTRPLHEILSERMTISGSMQVRMMDNVDLCMEWIFKKMYWWRWWLNDSKTHVLLVRLRWMRRPRPGASKLSVSKCKLIPEQIEMCHRVACEQEKCYFEEEEVLNCLMMGPPPSLSYAASPFLLMLLSGNKLTLTRSYKYCCGWTHSWMNVVCQVAHIYPRYL